MIKIKHYDPKTGKEINVEVYQEGEKMPGTDTECSMQISNDTVDHYGFLAKLLDSVKR